MSVQRQSIVQSALLACLVFCLSVSAQESNGFRTWTDSTGKFKLEASFEKFADGKVHLKRKDNGEILVVPVGQMSKDDQAFVRKLLAEGATKPSDTSSEAPASATESPAAPALEGTKAWQGNWNNRKFGTNGPLKCTATVKDDKTWDAKFEGAGLGRPFTYDVSIATSKKGERTLLQGTSTISGDRYQWTGYVERGVLFGRFRSASGNNGEFRLSESRQ